MKIIKKQLKNDIKTTVENYNTQNPNNSFLDLSEYLENYINQKYDLYSDAGYDGEIRDLEFFKNENDQFVIEIDIDCKTKQLIDFD